MGSERSRDLEFRVIGQDLQHEVSCLADHVASMLACPDCNRYLQPTEAAVQVPEEGIPVIPVAVRLLPVMTDGFAGSMVPAGYPEHSDAYLQSHVA